MFFSLNACICQKKAVILHRKIAKKTIKLTNMEAALRQPVLQGTISEEKWESLHTIEELDSALKNVIHKHFQG